MEFDEELTDSDFQGATPVFGDIDVLYLATHGMNPGPSYRIALYHEDLDLFTRSFGESGPKILVLDTCTMLEVGDPNWHLAWQQVNTGSALRLVLGFRTPATVALDPSVRGTAFALEMQWCGFTDAWFKAIRNSSYVGTDQPVALSFGDDAADARSVLNSASAWAIPGPRRSNAAPAIAWRY